MPSTILGLATADPSGSIAQSKAAEVAKAYGRLTEEQARLIPVLYRRTHVARRGSVLLDGHGDSTEQPRQSFYQPALAEADRGPTTRERMQRYEEEAAALALAAARSALAESGVTPQQITHVVTVSCTGFVAPGVDVALIKGLGLSLNVSRTNVGFMGCHGALNGLRTAAAYASSNPAARVLMVAVELCSLHYFYGWDPEKIVANALFADGAAAVVMGSLEPSPPGRGQGEGTSRFLDSVSTTNSPNDAFRSSKPPHPNPLPAAAKPLGEGAGWSLAASGACVFPDSEDAMTWIIGDHGFEMTLSARVPELIGTHLRPWMERWLAENGLDLLSVKSWAIHPGGPRIVGSVVEALGLPGEVAAESNQVLAERGNMSSPTILFILDRLRKSDAPPPCVALGFGPGLAAEAALFV